MRINHFPGAINNVRGIGFQSIGIVKTGRFEFVARWKLSRLDQKSAIMSLAQKNNTRSGPPRAADEEGTVSYAFLARYIL